jgi:hypothetical protein
LPNQLFDVFFSNVVHLFFFISYDLLVASKEIGEGKLHAPELLGDVQIREISTDGAYSTKLDSRRVTNQRIVELLQRYTKRQSVFDTEFSSELAPDSNNADSSPAEVGM